MPVIRFGYCLPIRVQKQNHGVNGILILMMQSITGTMKVYGLKAEVDIEK